MKVKVKVKLERLAPERWPDVERLFGEKGACAGCWCMFWRLERGERMEDVKGGEAKRRFKALVLAGKADGLLAYDEATKEPVGWLTFGPRRSFPKLDRAPSLACDDAGEVHALPCFFIRPGFRNQGVGSALLRAALKHLKADGARVAEGYPLQGKPGQTLAAAFAWTGTVPLFEKAGFRAVAPRPTGKQRMRKRL